MSATRVVLILHVRVIFPRVNARPDTANVNDSPKKIFTKDNVVPCINRRIRRPTVYLVTVRNAHAYLSQESGTLRRHHRQLVRFKRTNLLRKPIIRLSVSIHVVIPIPKDQCSVYPRSLRVKQRTTKANATSRRVTSMIVMRDDRYQQLLLYRTRSTLIHQRHVVQHNEGHRKGAIMRRAINDSVTKR